MNTQNTILIKIHRINGFVILPLFGGLIVSSLFLNPRNAVFFGLISIPFLILQLIITTKI